MKTFRQRTFCLELCKNGWTDQDVVWGAESGGPKKPYVRLVYGSPWDGAILRGKGMPWHTRQHPDMNCAKMAEPFEMLFGLWTRVGPRKHVLDGAQIPHTKGQLLGVRTCRGMPDDTLLWAVQKWLNRSICRFGCGIGWVEGSTT